jgi:L-seryl-tRNA(Ser) seleniumtransferase
LDDGADLVTFSADKLLGGPQGGVIVGRADLVRRCGTHPLARALRPGGLVLAALQHTALTYLHRDVVANVPFWRAVATTVDELRQRADAIVAQLAGAEPRARTTAMVSLPGAGSAPGVTMPSFGVEVPGDRLRLLREHDPPVIARTRDGVTLLDLRAVDPADDQHVLAALRRHP